MGGGPAEFAALPPIEAEDVEEEEGAAGRGGAFGVEAAPRFLLEVFLVELSGVDSGTTKSPCRLKIFVLYKKNRKGSERRVLNRKEGRKECKEINFLLPS